MAFARSFANRGQYRGALAREATGGILQSFGRPSRTLGAGSGRKVGTRRTHVRLHQTSPLQKSCTPVGERGPAPI